MPRTRATTESAGVVIAVASFAGQAPSGTEYSFSKGDRVRDSHQAVQFWPASFAPDGATSDEISGAAYALEDSRPRIGPEKPMQAIRQTGHLPGGKAGPFGVLEKGTIVIGEDHRAVRLNPKDWKVVE